MPSSFYRYIVLCAAVLPVLAGCGRPESGGGPPGEFMVQAVIAPVAPQPLDERVRLVASLQARDVVDVVSEINAVVTALPFEEGRPVSAGAVLARLDDRKPSARAREAQARLALARTNYERGKELLETETISKQEFDRLEAEFEVAEAGHALALEELRDTEIRAAFDGIVSERRVSVGQYVAAGRPLTSLVRIDPLEAVFHVPERFLGELAAGQQVEFTTAAFPGETFAGDVYFIDPKVDDASRTVRVKAELANTDGRLKPGLFAALELVLRSYDDALMIPESAVQYRGDQALVFVMTDEDRADIRPVTVGMRREGYLQITEGLAPGDRVVVEGYQKMFPGVGIIISPESSKYGIEPEPAQDDGVNLNPAMQDDLIFSARSALECGACPEVKRSAHFRAPAPPSLHMFEESKRRQVAARQMAVMSASAVVREDASIAEPQRIS